MHLRKYSISAAVLAVSALAIVGCGSSDNSATFTNNIKTGTYGGNGIELDVTASGQTLKVECGAGEELARRTHGFRNVRIAF